MMKALLQAVDPPMLASLRILIDADVVAARRTARALSESLAFTSEQRTQWAAAVGFVAQHALHTTGGADAHFEDLHQEGVRGIQATILCRTSAPLEETSGLRQPLFLKVQRAVDALSVDGGPAGQPRYRLTKWEDLGQRRLRERARDLI